MEKPTTEGIDVEYVANLARLLLNDAEKRVFQEQIGEIVGYIHNISSLDLSGIEPTSHAHPVTNVFRADAVKPGLDHDEVLKNAPEVMEAQFKVPRIVE